MQFYHVYVLESQKNRRLYIGFTVKQPTERLKEHNAGSNISTKAFVPWELIHYEGYLDREDAERRERYLKSNKGARVLKLMLKKYFDKKRK